MIRGNQYSPDHATKSLCSRGPLDARTGPHDRREVSGHLVTRTDCGTVASGKQPMVCFKMIYRWLYAGLLVIGTLAVLRHKGKHQKPAETRGKFAVCGEADCPTSERSTFSRYIWPLGTGYYGLKPRESKGCAAVRGCRWKLPLV